MISKRREISGLGVFGIWELSDSDQDVVAERRLDPAKATCAQPTSV